MVFKLVFKSLMAGKARLLCAVFGVASAVGGIVFVTSLSETNSAQAPALAERAVAPWAAWEFDQDIAFGRARGSRQQERTPAKAKGRPMPIKPDMRMQVVPATIDWRPGGRVLQGPPMRAFISLASHQVPYSSASISQGRWVEFGSSEPEFVCTRNTLQRFNKGEVAELGSTIKFVGRSGTMNARVVGYLDERRLPPGFPSVFVNDAAFKQFSAESKVVLSLWKKNPGGSVTTPRSESVVSFFKGDEQRRMDYARPLMLAAAVLTALSLMVNSLLLSVESARKSLSMLRAVGMTRGCAVWFVIDEAMISSALGVLLGIGLSLAALHIYVMCHPLVFPAGAAVDCKSMLIAVLGVVPVAVAAVLFALKSILSVKPLEAVSLRPRSRSIGMAVAFAFGFGAFVAVEVWGSSLMRGFIPSPEWPDAIVSLLPGGTSSFDIEKLRNIEGVERISELLPLQIDLKNEEPERGRQGERSYRPNALLLASERMPRFKFVEGDYSTSVKALSAGDSCVISLMMSRARNLHCGDVLVVLAGGPRGNKTEVALPIAGVVDVNWHMVTSRGLVRGLNGSSGMTDGPVFVSFDTLESLDYRPAAHVKMTHLWVEYDKDFLAEHGVFPAGRKVEASIAKALGNDPSYTVRLHARDEIADGTLAHGSDIIGQAARVPFVFLAILSIGFVAMLVARAEAHKREFAVLRAVGATKAQLAVLLTRSALATALKGIALALPFGAAAGWAFSHKTASVWPGMPHYFAVPWHIICEGALGAVVFALMAAIPTSIAIIKKENI